MATTKKKCKAIASASGLRCKQSATHDTGYCGTHHKQIYPTAEVTVGEATSPAEVIEQAGAGMPTIIEEAVTAASPEFAKFEIAKRVSHTLAQSNLVPDAYRGRPNDVFVAINMGSELGMEPFQAIQSIAVIEGKPCPCASADANAL